MNSKLYAKTQLSTYLIVPFVLYIYDKYLASKEHDIYNEFLTHHPLSEEGVTHTFYLRLGLTKVHLCSRCSGMFIGVISSYFFTHLCHWSEFHYKNNIATKRSVQYYRSRFLYKKNS